MSGWACFGEEEKSPAISRRTGIEDAQVKNIDFDAVVSFNPPAVRARDDWVAALGLELGNTISITGTFSGVAGSSPSRHAHFFAVDDMADRVEQAERGKTYCLRLKVLVGEGREAEWAGDDGIHSYPTCIVGFRILGFHERS